MCIAVAAEIIELYDNGKKAVALFKGNRININTGLVRASVGDFVLVHAGCAVEIVNSDTAAEIMQLYDMIVEEAAE